MIVCSPAETSRSDPEPQYQDGKEEEETKLPLFWVCSLSLPSMKLTLNHSCSKDEQQVRTSHTHQRDADENMWADEGRLLIISKEVDNVFPC